MSSSASSPIPDRRPIFARFEGLPNLVEFNLSKGPKVTDAGIAHIQNLQRLEVLVLDNTAVTDSGLSFIKRLPASRCSGSGARTWRTPDWCISKV